MNVLGWPRPELEEGERVLFESRASWSRRGVARGGTLVLTDRRLLFEPNSMEASIGLLPSSWPRSALREVAVARRGWGLLSGALRRRLRVTLGDGTAVLFVIGDVDAAARHLAAQL